MISNFKTLIVTPARNEAPYLVGLANSLELQTKANEIFWVVVSDGSTDNSREIFESLEVSFPRVFLEFESSGRLITGGAFKTWEYGVREGSRLYPDFTHVMKLDADVLLSPNYLTSVFLEADPNAGVLGGVFSGCPREQSSYVPGPVKMYSKIGYELVSSLPHETGFDVMDEVLCASSDLPISIVPTATFELARRIGVSQGILHGRYRNGLVCRWTGYAPEYFLLHLIRHSFRFPYLLGAAYMFTGYVRSSSGPYPQALRASHAEMQRKRLQTILKNPIKALRTLYFFDHN